LEGEGKELREAVRLNPNLADAHARLSEHLASVGRLDEASAEADRAQALDPERFHGLEVTEAKGQYDRAIAKIQKHLEHHPNDGNVYIDLDGLIDLYHFAGRHRESVEALQQGWTLFGFKEVGQGVGKAYATSGYSGALRYSAKQMERLYAEHKVHEPTWIARWYERSGDDEQALKWVRIGLADNNNCWPGLDDEPDFTSLHSDQRFQALMKQMRLPQ
jgi:tetratricopeptide (TPR) repeat protein